VTGLRSAISLLTIIPVQAPEGDLRSSIVFFPVVGALLGVFAAMCAYLATLLLPAPIAGAAIAGLLAVITGGLHEDGLADVADAFRSTRTPEQIAQILKDSRVGSHAVLTLIVFIMIRAQSFGVLALRRDWIGIVLAVTLSRCAPVLLGYLSRPFGDGLGAQFIGAISYSRTVVVVVLGVVALTSAGWRVALALVGVNALVVLCARRYFERRLGGVTGDCLGAVTQVCETASLLVFVCLSST
jgi:adenosylcobinamide-GDP ribazoletransferase